MASLGAPAESRWIKWGGNFVLGGAILVIVIALGALTLARFDMIAKISGFIAFMMMLNPARVLAAVGIVVLLIAFVRKTGPKRNAITGTVLAGAFLTVLYTQVIIPGGKVPPIHDITTNMDNPPQFTTLDRPEVSTGPFSVEEWRAFHSGAYGNIQPIVINKSPVDALADARALMEQRGWDVVVADQDTGHLEGTAYAGYLKFRDDVVLKVTPIEDGSSRIDMRSVSQVGVSDLGYNAARIEAFLADLQAM